jgi:indolepyruvate ferredoxin oxidoreductase
VAYQQGLIPISATSIAEAIELNGVAIELNQQSFLWGRRYAEDAAGVCRDAGLDEGQSPDPGGESLDDLITRCHTNLIDYQDRVYADRYMRLVQRVRQHETELHPLHTDTDLPLTKAVARSYHKLLAYKDEYEVARLYSNGDFEKSLAAQFEGDYHLRFHLAPPLLAKRDPASGKPLKREFGGWMLGLFGLLARFKGLRGGALDIFGYTTERKLERSLIIEFEQQVDTILNQVKPDNLAIAVEMASLPLKMRGFGHVKLANIEQAQRRAELLSRQLTGRDLAVELFSP